MNAARAKTGTALAAAGPAPRHTLHIVSGKGGTGKTTVAAALACALATAGRRVLICEVEGRQGIAELFEVASLTGPTERRLLRTADGGDLFGLSIDAEDALLEYLDSFYHLGLAGRALDRVGAVDFATSIAPGLRDVLLTGKVYEAVRRREKGLPNAYDAVVLDAPPTGRIAQFLNVHEAVSGLAKMGPIRNQAESIMRVLRSASTVVHLVTLLEDMPVTETEEAVEDLAPTKIRVGTVIANMVIASPLTDDELSEAAADGYAFAVPGLTKAQNATLAREYAADAARALEQRARQERLAGLGLAMAELAYDPAGVDLGALPQLAVRLREQLALEVT
ncbi:ArsA-related P-loop ATPase [Microlunatus ginsengisoli]|uniref:ArsA-related P-loop ATPase n=1 Tax=Microlunatus ginsengisoli TaxID=363863 RepID=A0ABP7ANT7_9ACTN